MDNYLPHLMIKISQRSFTQHFDNSLSSFSSEKRIKFDNLIYTVQGDKKENMYVRSDNFK